MAQPDREAAFAPGPVARGTVAADATDARDPAPSAAEHREAFPTLTPEQTDALARYGQRRPTGRGDTLFREGDPMCDFYVVLSGRVAIVTGFGEDERELTVHGPGEFLGELSLLSGQAVFGTAVVRDPGEVLVVPVHELREVLGDEPAIADLILQAYLAQRSMLLGAGSGLKIFGSRYSPDTARLREFVARNRLPHRWIDLEEDPTADALLTRLGVAPEDTPVVVWRDRLLRNPPSAELAEALGLRVRTTPEVLFDLIVVGSGPAGLAAAVYGASEGLDTIVFDATATGGQAGTSTRIENYLGFPTGISGAELAERAVIQARKFGARISLPAAAASMAQGDGHYVVGFEDGGAAFGRTVLVATGARYRRLGAAGIERFEGVGVHYAATPIEAELCRNDPVAVVGGANSAGQGALYLSRYAARVHLVVRGDDLRSSMSRYLADRIEHNPVIDVLTHTEVRELHGDRKLAEIVVEDNRSHERRTLACRALFVFIGAEPHAGWLGGFVALDDKGFVLTGPAAVGAGPGSTVSERVRSPSFLETSRPGIFAAGDIRSGSIKRVAAAVGEGSASVRLVHEHLASQHGPTAHQ